MARKIIDGIEYIHNNNNEENTGTLDFSLQEEQEINKANLVKNKNERTKQIDNKIQEENISSITTNNDRFNYKSFRGKTFEELDTKIEIWLRTENKRILTISSFFDGKEYFSLIATNPTEVSIVSPLKFGRVLVDDQ